MQPRAHVVELVGEALEFVAGFDRNALREITAPKALRTGPQSLDRTDHAPGQEYPREHSEDRRSRQHDREALQRQIQRGVGLLHRQFDKHCPTERRDRRGRGQHLLALDVLGALQRLRPGAGVSSLRRLHLQQLRHVGVSQHQANVRMRNQSSLSADDIGMSALADLDLRNHVPDQLQIDFGDADPGILAGAGQRQRHIGLGLAAEIYRTVIDLVRHRFGELRIFGKIEPAIDHVHGQARYPQALLARRIHLRQFGNRGHLAQQPQRVEPALLDRAGGPWQLRGPPQLAFNFLDKLTDFRCRRLGLLVLDADQGNLVLAVIKEDLKDAIGQQRDGDHRDEQRDIFRKQAAAALGAGWRRRRRAKHRRGRQRPAIGRVRVQRNGHLAQPSKMARACLLSHCGRIIRSPRRPAQAGSRGRSSRALSPL